MFHKWLISSTGDALKTRPNQGVPKIPFSLCQFGSWKRYELGHSWAFGMTFIYIRGNSGNTLRVLDNSWRRHECFVWFKTFVANPGRVEFRTVILTITALFVSQSGVFVVPSYTHSCIFLAFRRLSWLFVSTQMTKFMYIHLQMSTIYYEINTNGKS